MHLFLALLHAVKFQKDWMQPQRVTGKLCFLPDSLEPMSCHFQHGQELLTKQAQTKRQHTKEESFYARAYMRWFSTNLIVQSLFSLHGERVRRSRLASTVVLAVGLFALCSVASAVSAEASSVGIRQGDWAKYVGSPPIEEYEWIHLSFLQVKGSFVDVSMRYDVRARYRSTDGHYWPDHPRLITIDTKSGIGNYFFFLVPPNLTVGDSVPGPVDYTSDLRIVGTEVRKYAGAKRTIVCARYENRSLSALKLNVQGIFYWDRETGLLVEDTVKIEDFYVTSQKLTETNLWSADLADWLFDNSVVVIFIISGIVSSAFLTVFLFQWKKTAPSKVTHPTIGKLLIASGTLLLVGGFVTMSNFNQFFSSLCFALVPLFFVTGILVYTGGWVALGQRGLVVDIGTVLMASAMVLAGATVGFATYRELGALVPYRGEGFFHGYSARALDLTYTLLEGVFFYPYSWLTAILVPVVLSLAVVGFFYKMFRRF